MIDQDDQLFKIQQLQKDKIEMENRIINLKEEMVLKNDSIAELKNDLSLKNEENKKLSNQNWMLKYYTIQIQGLKRATMLII